LTLINFEQGSTVDLTPFPFIDYLIGERIKVGDTAKSTRNIAYIMHRGNVEGVRYLLWKLHEKSHVDFPDNLHFVVRKRIEK